MSLYEEKTMKYALLILLMGIPLALAGMGKTFNDEHKHFTEPPFEKIYVRPDQLCTFENGVYYFDEGGKTRKVRAVLNDCDGTYVIFIKHQCPLCGRSWNNNEPDEGYGCPIFQRRYHPSTWSP